MRIRNRLQGVIACSIALYILGCGHSPKREDEMKSYEHAFQSAADEDQKQKVDEAYSVRFAANKDFSNDQLLTAALKVDGSNPVGGSLLVALDSRGYKFTSPEIPQFLLKRGVSSIQGRMFYGRFLRDNSSDAVRAFVKQFLVSQMMKPESEERNKEQLVCWRVAFAKHPEIRTLETDPEVGVLVKRLISTIPL